mgnify:CR=1 FL=1
MPCGDGYQKRKSRTEYNENAETAPLKPVSEEPMNEYPCKCNKNHASKPACHSGSDYLSGRTIEPLQLVGNENVDRKSVV